MPRRAVLCGLAGGCGAALSPAAVRAVDLSFLAEPSRDNGLQNKWLEKLRIVLQDSADDISYGGELAPGGPPSAKPELLLAAIVQMEATLKKLAPMLADQSKWDAARLTVSTGPFAPLEFKRIFNAYSDNIYYTTESSEANAYLLGGASPSSRQTTQYLLRNEALRQLGELRDELKYQQGLPVAERETEVAFEALAACVKAFDDYLKLAPPDELQLATIAASGQQAPSVSRSALAGELATGGAAP